MTSSDCLNIRSVELYIDCFQECLQHGQSSLLLWQPLFKVGNIVYFYNVHSYYLSSFYKIQFIYIKTEFHTLWSSLITYDSFFQKIYNSLLKAKSTFGGEAQNLRKVIFSNLLHNMNSWLFHKMQSFKVMVMFEMIAEQKLQSLCLKIFRVKCVYLILKLKIQLFL